MKTNTTSGYQRHQRYQRSTDQRIFRAPLRAQVYPTQRFLRYNQNMSDETVSIPTDLDLTAFISREAHDLKSPFNRILGFTKMVLKGMDGPLTDLQREDLTTVYQNSQQAMSFVSNLIDMARLQRGEKTPEWQDCTLKEVLERAAQEWRTGTPEESASLEMHLPASSPIQADKTLLRQAFRHVLHYLSTWVKAPATLQVEATLSQGAYQIRLQAHGEHNLAAPEMELTMWSFIAQHIFQLHNGEIHTARRGKQGAEFHITLPTHPQKAPAAEA